MKLRAESPELRAKPAAVACLHCGVPLVGDKPRSSGFCCSGCQYVHRLVHEHGLDAYYRIKDTVTAPVDPSVFQPADLGWAAELQRDVEGAGAAAPETTVGVQGISCAGCVWLIERIFRQLPGAREIRVNAAQGAMHLRWTRGEFSLPEFSRKLHAFGYAAGPVGDNAAAPESRGLVIRIGLCAAFTMNAMLFTFPVYFGMTDDFRWAGLFGLLSLVFGTLSLLVGGTYFIARAIAALRARALHIDLPIAIGIAGAYGGSLFGWAIGRAEYVYFDFVATFILLMLVGRWAQVAAVERNRRRLLGRAARPTRIQLAGGATVEADRIRPGDRMILSAGQTLPVDARLETGSGSFSLASINGEPEPRACSAGRRIPSGAINIGRGPVELVALQGWTDSLLRQLIAPGERPASSNRFLERIVQGYIAGILIVAAVSGAAWWFATGDLMRAGAVVTAVLVVSCPCAVALAFPLSDEIAAVRVRQAGVFIREADLWPRLARIRTLVFDKTGTLTLEAPTLRNPEALAALSTEERSALFALVEDNPHPVSQCLAAELLSAGPVVPLPGTVSESIGSGIELLPIENRESRIENSKTWSLGRAGWRDAEAGNATHFCRAGAVLARFEFVDTARPETAAELRALEDRGLDIRIASGDRAAKVAVLARQLGLPESTCLGDLSPGEKAAWIDRIGADQVMMLGDGANDSLAFDRALCRGTPVVHRGILERKADFYYLGAGIGGLRALFEVDRVRRRTQRLILIFSVAYNLLAVGLAVAGRMNPLVAAALMPVNSLATLGIVVGGMSRRERSRRSAVD